MKKTIYLDFDGVLNIYNGWQGEDELFEPQPASEDFLKKLSGNFKVYIFTSRDSEKVYKWLIKYHLQGYIEDVTNIKNPAYLYIDDRAIKFDGDFNTLLADIESFKPYWKQAIKEC